MKVKLFSREGCTKCPEAKKLLDQIIANDYETFDVDTDDGLAEASYYGVMSTPSILILGNNDEVITSWKGVIPSEAELLNLLK